MGFYGEQYVFTDRDIYEIRVHSLKDTNIYTSLEGSGQVTTYPPNNADLVGTKFAMCHNDRVDVGVDGQWVRAKMVNSTDDATINQNETVSNGFVFYHARQTGIGNNAKIEINTSTVTDASTLLDYDSKFAFPVCNIDKAGHITTISARGFQMPGVIKEQFEEIDWKNSAKYGSETKPPAMKVIGPIVNTLLTRVDNLTSIVTDEKTGLQVKVEGLTSTSSDHETRIDNLEAEMGLTSGTNKPGLEFDPNVSLKLKPISGYTSYMQPGNRATLLNYYSNSEQSASGNIKYLDNTNKAYGNYSLASGLYTQATREYSEAGGYATYAMGNSAHAEGRGFYRKKLYSGLELDANNVFNVKSISIVDNTNVRLEIDSSQLSSLTNFIVENWSITSSAANAIVQNGYVGVPCSNTDYRIYPIRTVHLSPDYIEFNPADPLIDESRENLSVNDFKNLGNIKIFIYIGGAFGANSHVENYATNARGANSHAEGRFSIASGTGTHAEGGYTWASGTYAHAEGRFSIASGEDSHAEGNKTNATGKCSHAEGVTTNATHPNTAQGEASHSEGENALASGKYSHAEGCSDGTAHPKATGLASHCEGGACHATASYSHAQGQQTTANHIASHSGGFHTKTTQDYSTVVGKYNNTNAGLFVVGCGSENSKNNALRVTDSNVYGKTYQTSGADYAEYFEWADQNIYAEDRIGYFVSFDKDDMIKIGGTDDILGVVSATAAIVANSYEEGWNEQYKKDIYGRIQYEKYVDDNGVIGERPILNEEFNPDLTYIPRSQRPEWAVIGMIGRLIVRDDGSCIPGKHCMSNGDGIATASTFGYRVLKRLDDSHIQILFK